VPATGERDRMLVLALTLCLKRYFTEVAPAGVLNAPVVKKKNADTVLKYKEENKAVADVSFGTSRFRLILSKITLRLMPHLRFQASSLERRQFSPHACTHTNARHDNDEAG
jgi:hypothetical protein